MNIRFEKFSLRPLEQADADAYYSLVQKNKTRLDTYFPATVRENLSIESSKAHVEARIERAIKKEFITWVIVDEVDSKLAGVIFLKDIDWRILKGELGFYVDADYEGKGLVGRAIKGIIDYAFSELQMQKLYMRVAPENKRSLEVATRNGFIKEGTIRKDFKTTQGELIDVVYFGLLKSDLQTNVSPAL